MGTTFMVKSATIRIPRTRHKAALAALRKGQKKYPPFYARSGPAPEVLNLVDEMVHNWLWEPRLDADYNLVSIKPVIRYGQKFDREEGLFKLLAPFVSSGEVILDGEDGFVYRWEFRGGKVKQTKATSTTDRREWS